MDLDTLMTDTSTVPEPTSRAFTTGRRALDDALGAATHSATSNRGHRTRRGPRVGIAVLAAAAAAAALIAGPILFLGNHDPGASAGASELLRRAGTAAGTQPGGWPSVPYWHSVAVIREGSDSGTPGRTYKREIWIGHGRQGVLEDPTVDVGIVPISVAGFTAGSHLLSWADLYSLPTDPRALEGELRADINGAGPDDDTELYTMVGDLLRESPAPPALRRALWDVASTIPGVTLVGAVTDGAGRHGMAVERAGQRYVVDPTTGRLLEESEDGGMRTTYLRQGPASTAPTPTTSATGASSPG